MHNFKFKFECDKIISKAQAAEVKRSFGFVKYIKESQNRYLLAFNLV